MLILKIAGLSLLSIWTAEVLALAWLIAVEYSKGETKRLLREDDGGFLWMRP